MLVEEGETDTVTEADEPELPVEEEFPPLEQPAIARMAAIKRTERYRLDLTGGGAKIRWRQARRVIFCSLQNLRVGF
jgi:hypothetical protein